MKVSKIVLIVVGLHVLLIGGIFMFEGCSRASAPTPDFADNESQTLEPMGQPMTEYPAQMPVEQIVPPSTLSAPAAITQPQPIVATAPVPAPIVETTIVAPPPTPSMKMYVVKKGDSLWKIAKTESVKLGDLMSVNNMKKTTVLQIGQELQIPQDTSSSIARDTAGNVSPTSIMQSSGNGYAETGSDIYTVKSGDSLWKIARDAGTTVAELKRVNGLQKDSINIGLQLEIPSARTSRVEERVAPNINAGSVITANREWHEPGTYIENGQTIHIVDVDETPSTIAKQYGIRQDELMRTNQIENPRQLYPGQRLIIPAQQRMDSNIGTTAPYAAIPHIEPSDEFVLAAPIVSASRALDQ